MWRMSPPRSAMHVVWDVHDVFFDWFLQKHPRHLSLHGAAVRIGRGLVCFPSVQRAGKSTLCVALAASGHTLYCDDVLPIEPGRNRGVAMGIAPLMRRPLPAGLGAPLTRFIADRPGPAYMRWTYVNLRGNEIASLGETAPLDTLVLLRREDRREARLEPVSRSEMLREIVRQNFAREVPPAQILDRLLAITARAGCYRLRYGRVANAVRLLTERFGRDARRRQR
jgi:hypothetical protein